jgi:chemotaxis family two-component system sensor kinase Cph1
VDFFDYFANLLNTSDFPPRWSCGTGWTPFTGWFYLLSDLGIFSAYMSIPALLLYFVSKRKDIIFPRIFWLFASFIFACGISHLLDALMFWWPAYRLNGFERFLTATISWTTVVALVPIIPMALSLKSPTALEKEVNERMIAEAKLKELNENLEKIVEERTASLQAAHKEMEAFSYSVSHDLKAPLRRIEQFSEMIQTEYGDKVDTELADYLQRIRNNSHNMTMLVEDLLRFSRVNRNELNKSAVDLAELAAEVCRELADLYENRQVQCKLPERLFVYGDPGLLKVTLHNLLDNAWKYTVRNPDARVEIGKQGDAIFIRDNGVGFKPEQAKDIFIPFHRLHSREEFPGTGIGLATVQRIIHRHGGRIWAEGNIDAGATFYFTLPPEENA